nr:helix-turn-helix transcriptional regulator [Thiocystis violacea]
MVFSTRWLDQPVAGADPKALEHLSGLIADLEHLKTASFIEAARQVAIELLVSGHPSTERIASALGLSRRTLYRRMAAEGTSVHALMNEIRHELARQLLLESRMPLNEIAATLHYSEPGAFSRAFRGWTGMTPSAYRAAVRGNPRENRP